MNIPDSLLRGQPLDCRDFQDSDRDKQSSLFSVFSDRELKDPKILVGGETQDRILCALNESSDGLKALQIAEAAHIHRSTVSNNCNELLNLGLIEKSVIPGTENHTNPTLLYRISEKFKNEVEAFLRLKLQARPDLWTVYNPGVTEQISKAEEQNAHLSLSPSCDERPESFEEQVKLGLKMMAERILALQEEVNSLKRRLDEKPSNQTDLSEVFELFDALSPQSANGGAK